MQSRCPRERPFVRKCSAGLGPGDIFTAGWLLEPSGPRAVWLHLRERAQWACSLPDLLATRGQGWGKGEKVLVRGPR